MKTIITNITCTNATALSRFPTKDYDIHFSLDTFNITGETVANIMYPNSKVLGGEAELLFGDDLKEYKKFKENKEKIKNILGEDFNMEINLKEIVEKVLDERAAKELHETNYEIECLKQKVRELEANNAKLTTDNTTLAESFKQLVDDQVEAIDYIDKLEGELSYFEANEAAEIDDDVTDYLDECLCCGYPCCADESLEMNPAIKAIYFCDEPGKEKTIVLFADGTKVIKELVKGDKFDLNVGVALCVAERMYGGKTKYHKMVKKISGAKDWKPAAAVKATKATTKKIEE